MFRCVRHGDAWSGDPLLVWLNNPSGKTVRSTHSDDLAPLIEGQVAEPQSTPRLSNWHEAPTESIAEIPPHTPHVDRQ